MGVRRFSSSGILLFLVAHDSNVVHAQTVNCTLCHDGSIPEDLDTPVFIDESVNVTCRELLERATTRSTVDGCELIQGEGVALCNCPLPPSGINLNCTLCQDGSSPADPNLTFVPGFPCSSLVEFVKSDEREGACEAYQKTAGTYCDCPLDEGTPNVCRLCGDAKELPDPGLLVPRSESDLDEGHEEGSVHPCSALEFDANFFYEQCSRYQQAYGAACCGNETDITTSAVGSHYQQTGAVMLILIAGATAVNIGHFI